ncbi:hypothetical protein Tco_0403257 [Tanacetum coccineum]
MINQCITGKTSGFDKPRYPVLHILWGIITRINVDYAELMWEEFVQAIHTFLVDKANLGSPAKKGNKTKPHVIPYCRFTKLIICHLGRKHNPHQRSDYPFHLAIKDLRLRNLKFVPKGKDEVFGIRIPNVLITNSIRNEPYYQAYIEMVAKHDSKIASEREGKKKSTSKADTSKKPASKVLKKVQKEKSPLKLVDEEEEVQHEPVPELQGKVINETTTGPSLQPQDDIFEKAIQDTSSPADSTNVPVKGADSEKASSGSGTEAGSDPGRTPESRPLPNNEKMEED